MASILFPILSISFLPLIAAYGQSTVINSCSFPVNLWVVSNTQGPMHTLPPGGIYSNTFEINPAGGGISIKLTPDPYITDPITQFEYTLAGPLIYYDISDVNGSPFEPYGLTLKSNDASCIGAICKPNSDCEGMIYNQPNDDFATQACGSGADLTFTLCNGGGAIASPPAPVPAPAPAPMPAPPPMPAPSTPNLPISPASQTPPSVAPVSTPWDTTMPTPPAPTTFRTSVIPATPAQAPPVTSAYPNAYQPVQPSVTIATAFVTDVQTFTDVISEVVTTTVT